MPEPKTSSSRTIILIASAISLALGGGTGTLAADYRVAQRVQDLDTRMAVIETKVGSIERTVEDATEKAEQRGEQIHDMDKKVDRVLIILEERGGSR